MQVDFVVGEHESDALMLADRTTEGMPAPGMFHRDRLAAPRRTEPAHAVRQPCRSKPNLGIAEALTDLPQHAIRRDADAIERDFGVTAGRVRVDRLQHAVDAKSRRIEVNEE